MVEWHFVKGDLFEIDLLDIDAVILKTKWRQTVLMTIRNNLNPNVKIDTLV